MYFILLLSYFKFSILDLCNTNIRRDQFPENTDVNQDESNTRKPEQASIPGVSQNVCQEVLVRGEPKRDQKFYAEGKLRKDSNLELLYVLI